MWSLRAARIKAPSLSSRLLQGLFKGVARLDTVVLDEWSRGRGVLRAAQLRALAFDRRLFGRLVPRARDNARIRGRLLDRPCAFTRTPPQANMVLRGLVLGDGAIA